MTAPGSRNGPGKPGGVRPRGRRADKPKAVADDARHLLAWHYPGKELLDKLALVTDRDNTLYRLLWAYGLDGPSVLSLAQREFLAGAVDPAAPARPWGRLVELLVQACNDPEVQADEQVYGLADLFARLAGLCEMAGTSAVVGRALDLAQAQRGAAAETRATGDDNRERVLAAWQADEAQGKPERGRAGRCAEKLKLPVTTVKSVVERLRSLRLLPPKRSS